MMKTFRTALALLALLGTMAPTVAAQQKVAVEGPRPRQIQVTILGMSCPFCAYGVEQKLKKLEGVEDLKVELKTGLATLTLKEGVDIPNEELQKKVEDAGFEVAKIVRTFESEYPDFERKQKK
jgi:mercuric ion binding protein